MQEQARQFLRYLKDKKGYSDNTIAAYRNDLSQFVAFLVRETTGTISVWTEIGQPLILRYGEHLDQQSYAPSTIARKVASVKSFFAYLTDTGVLTDNPTAALDAPKVEKRMPRILSMEEVEWLLDEPAKGTTPKALRDRALLDLFYATGMRVSEVIALRLDDLDMAQAQINCANRDGKTRQLPLTPRAFESLTLYLEKGRVALLRGRAERTLFLNQRGHPLTRQGLWLIIKSYAEAAGIGQDVTPHTLRHSFAVHRLAQGSDLHKVRELLGHANISTTQVYAQLNPQPEAESDADLA